MRRQTLTIVLAQLALVTGCAVRPRPVAPRPPAPQKAPVATSEPEPEPKLKLAFLDGLDAYARKVSTDSKLAQRYFNQGLVLLQGFNHFAAAQAFQAAADADPECAMAYVGLALANGPHINRWIQTSFQTQEAWRAVQAAKRAKHATALERDLVNAVATRYVQEERSERKDLDLAFASAMRELWKKHPDDADIGAWFAESVMMLRPWDYWDKQGNPNPGTEEILDTLAKVMQLNENHPLALHLYIHAREGSKRPQDALAAANRLRLLVPGHSHLLHMPSHIDSRSGDWNRAVETNLRAVAADEAALAKNPDQGFYFVYTLHNRHLLTYAAMMVGRSKEAIYQAEKIVASVPKDWAEKFRKPADGYYAMPAEVLMRFGKWDKILEIPQWPKEYVLARTLRHYARGVAFASTLEPELARQELKAMIEEAKRIESAQRFGTNRAKSIATLAQAVLEGEVLYREGKVDAGIAKLREAVALEDGLAYGEPPSWVQPVRHALGAALLQQKRFAQAEAVYRNDLVHKPNNGWGLWGLARALERQGKVEESKKVQKHFEEVWKHADIELSTSCLCLPGV